MSDELKPDPMKTGVGEFCQPGDRREPRWMIVYDDPDRTHSVFENEEDAREAFANSEGMGWNCWLFGPTPRAIRPAAEAAPCKLCQSIGPDVPCAYPTEINRQQAQRIAQLEATLAAEAESAKPFQARVQPWMTACFGAEISADVQERNHRFLEEAIELVQACGSTASEAHQLVDYVYGRPVGEKVQEVGGVMVTLAALCLAQGLDMHAAGETELERIWTKVEAIRAKQAAKPKHSPLPMHVAADPALKDEEIAELRGALDASYKITTLLTHKLLTCGVAARHPDANLSKRGSYGGKWNSQQAEEVRALREAHGALLAQREGSKEAVLSDEEIQFCANDGHRNAAGGIYAGSVVPFARSVLEAQRDASKAEPTS